MGVVFSVLTPTYNAYPWIRSCVASVADQQGVTVQHIVQDGLSTDGTAEYVAAETRVVGESCKDGGMYDAINRAWAKSEGEFVAHLNGDEELLPMALNDIAAVFRSDPKIDVVIGGVLMCKADGTLECHRKPLRPTLGILLTSHHPVQSCAIFFRRASFASRPWLYDPKFRIISDALLMIDILRGKKKIALLNRFTSVFLMTGKNLGLSQSPTAIREYKHQMSLAPRWMRLMRPVIRKVFQMQKLGMGHYRRESLTYEIYVPGDDVKRHPIQALNAGGVYRPEQTVSEQA